jgi:hypothetical protein
MLKLELCCPEPACGAPAGIEEVRVDQPGLAVTVRRSTSIVAEQDEPAGPADVADATWPGYCVAVRFRCSEGHCFSVRMAMEPNDTAVVLTGNRLPALDGGDPEEAELLGGPPQNDVLKGFKQAKEE